MNAGLNVAGPVLTRLKPFTLSLSKCRARLRQAQPERVFEIQKRRMHHRDGRVAGMAMQIARARAACRRAME
ncbi:hypothetical protein, partial [Paracidovorax sp. MALMAid1276]|uniref:hypothetical protein n=1 Tax=Paracidovorax sp. MALMAid1276 TaxID=3411631 RepID=UPI003B9B1A44